MRIIVVCLILLTALFIGHSAYDRVVAERRLNQAIGSLPMNPLDGYRTMKEVLGYNRLVAMGKIGDVEQRFLQAMEKEITGTLTQKPAPADIYPAVEQAMAALEALNKQTHANVSKTRVAILKAARESVEPLKEKGTLKAWDNMTAMFQSVSGNMSLIAEAFGGSATDDFSKWFDEVKATPRRPIGLRDAETGATQASIEALSKLKMSAAGKDEKPVAPAPAKLDDESLIAAEKGFAAGLGALENFMGLFAENEMPAELCALRAKITYNRAAIKLAHFQDRQNTILRTGSEYMAEFLVRSDTSVIPSASEMVAAWEQSAQADFRSTQRYLTQASTLDDAMKRAYTALAIWAEGDLWWTLNQRNPGQDRARALQAAQGVTGNAGAQVIQAMRTSPRALLIVDFP